MAKPDIQMSGNRYDAPCDQGVIQRYGDGEPQHGEHACQEGEGRDRFPPPSPKHQLLDEEIQKGGASAADQHQEGGPCAEEINSPNGHRDQCRGEIQRQGVFGFGTGSEDHKRFLSGWGSGQPLCRVIFSRRGMAAGQTYSQHPHPIQTAAMRLAER